MNSSLRSGRIKGKILSYTIKPKLVSIRQELSRVPISNYEGTIFFTPDKNWLPSLKRNKRITKDRLSQANKLLSRLDKRWLHEFKNLKLRKSQGVRKKSTKSCKDASFRTLTSSEKLISN